MQLFVETWKSDLSDSSHLATKTSARTPHRRRRRCKRSQDFLQCVDHGCWTFKSLGSQFASCPNTLSTSPLPCFSTKNESSVAWGVASTQSPVQPAKRLALVLRPTVAPHRYFRNVLAAEFLAAISPSRFPWCLQAMDPFAQQSNRSLTPKKTHSALVGVVISRTYWTHLLQTSHPTVMT